MKKYLKFISVLFVSLIFSSYVFAAQVNKSDATLSVTSREECTIRFGKYGEFEKRLVEINEENKTIDIRLTVRNTYDGATSHEEEQNDELPGEVVFLIDSSDSMNTPELNSTRKELIINATLQLVDKLFDLNENVKIAVTEFSSVSRSGDSPVTVGTDNDANKLIDLSNNKNDIKSAIQTVSSLGPKTDLDIGLKTAATQFSNDTSLSKHLVILTDGVPNISEATGNRIEYSPEVTNATISRLTSIHNSGINIATVLADSDFYDLNGDLYVMDPDTSSPYNSGSRYSEPITHMEIAHQIFGTTESPKFGSVFYVEGENVATAITNKIYDSLRTTKTISVDDIEKYTLTDVVIKDYFPQNIVDNFNFSKLSEPQIGTVSDSIDTTDNSITWNIDRLEPKQSSTFVYRLSLKDTFDGEILDLNLPTNEKVTIDYKEGGEPGEPVESTKSPAVKLTMPTPEPPKKDDPTVAPTPIPQTGSYIWAVFIVGLGISTYFAVKLNKLRK